MGMYGTYLQSLPIPYAIKPKWPIIVREHRDRLRRVLRSQDRYRLVVRRDTGDQFQFVLRRVAKQR